MEDVEEAGVATLVDLEDSSLSERQSRFTFPLFLGLNKIYNDSIVHILSNLTAVDLWCMSSRWLQPILFT